MPIAVHPQYGIASRTLEQSQLKTVMMAAPANWLVPLRTASWTPSSLAYLVTASLTVTFLLITDDAADPAAIGDLRSAGAQVDLTKPLRSLTEA